MKKILLSCLSLMFAAALSAADYYVATTGDDTNDGLSKETPFVTIAKAIESAVDNDVIYVAGGTYETTWGKASKTLTISGSWNADFSEQPQPNGEKPWVFTNPTIVSVAGVVYTVETPKGGLIDGITFSNDKIPVGTIALFTQNASFKRCAFKDNTFLAGGVNEVLHIRAPGLSTNPVLENCLFDNNQLVWGENGILNCEGAAALIKGCVFSRNSNATRMIKNAGTSRVVNCSFFNNQSIRTTLINGNLKSEIINCLIYNNTFTTSNSSLITTTSKIVNTIIVNNVIPDKIANGVTSETGIVLLAGGEIYNSIIVGNTKPDKTPIGFTGNILATIKNCAFDGAALGELVIAADNISLSEELPKFVSPTSFAGSTTKPDQLAELATADWSLVGSSSLVDAGKMDLFSTTIYGALNEFDILGNNRKFGEEIDMGTYETTYSVISATSADETKGTVTGGGRYSIGEEATLIATAISPALFGEWSNGTATLTNDATYTFKVDAATAAINYVATFDNSTSIGGEALLQSSLYTSPGQLCISGVEGLLTAFNSAGVKVVQQLITGSATISLSKDFYIVQIQNEQGISTSKVVIP